MNRSYGALGLVKHIVPDRFTLGFYALVPLSSLTTAQSFYPDEREALFSNSLHPELYGDRLTSISFVLGAAFKLLPQISIGASLSLGLANTASTNTYVRDATNYSTLLLDNSITTQVDLAPTVGITYKPVSWLRFGGTLHSPEKFSVDTTIRRELFRPAGHHIRCDPGQRVRLDAMVGGRWDGSRRHPAGEVHDVADGLAEVRVLVIVRRPRGAEPCDVRPRARLE